MLVASTLPCTSEKELIKGNDHILACSLKEALIEGLLTIERTVSERREHWLSQQDEVLTWRLRTEVAEARLKSEQMALKK